jgi:hypothetical protein
MKLAQSRTLRPSKMPSSMGAPATFVGLIPRRGIAFSSRSERFAAHLTDVGGTMQRGFVGRSPASGGGSDQEADVMACS